MVRVATWAILAGLALGLVQIPSARAQSHPAYIRLGAAKGVLYTPDSGSPPHIGVIVIHRTSNFLSHPACTQLSQRGFLVLCMNSRYDNNETLVRFETIALDVKAGVNFLHQQPGITKVVLFGHSGGGSTLSFYQAVAEKGPSYCQGPDKLAPCGNDLAGLPPADGIVFADAHPGEPVQIMRGLNPSFVRDAATGGWTVDPMLDPFNPKNGYNAKGASHFSPAFQTRYFAAQAKEMNTLIDTAVAGLEKGKAGGLFTDDDVLVIRGGGNPGSGDAGRAFLFVMDPSIPALATTVRPEKLLKNDGTIATQIITSVKAADPDLVKNNRTFDHGTKVYTWRSFLSSNAVRAKDSVEDIDFCSSNNMAACAVKSISVPILIAAMGAHDFVRDDEKMFDATSSKDKDFITVEGAVHGFTPCKRCETTPGQYSNTMKNLFDYTASWINKRF
jgi:hypothetical protein